MAKLNKKQKLLDIIENIRISLAQHNGDLQLVEYNEKLGIVTVSLLGACAHCNLSDITVKFLVEHEIRSKLPSIKKIKVV
jgi:Fe-S cluster biogenesis protein NfuA